jgi:uncharacterized protein with HEPN domain
MRHESKTYLFDIAKACQAICEFTKGKSYEDYEDDNMLRSAVERQFEIIGEAMNRLGRVELKVANAIPEYQRIIAFRNILIHGYAVIQSHTVWGVIEGDLPALAERVDRMLSSAD